MWLHRGLQICTATLSHENVIHKSATKVIFHLHQEEIIYFRKKSSTSGRNHRHSVAVSGKHWKTTGRLHRKYNRSEQRQHRLCSLALWHQDTAASGHATRTQSPNGLHTHLPAMWSCILILFQAECFFLSQLKMAAR